MIAAIACAGVDTGAILQCVAFAFDVLAVVAIVARRAEPPGTDLPFQSARSVKKVRFIRAFDGQKVEDLPSKTPVVLMQYWPSNTSHGTGCNCEFSSMNISPQSMCSWLLQL